MPNVIPSIGMTGVWPLKPPLDVYLAEEAIYTCRAIRSINEYIAQNIDPFETVYKPLSLTQAIYDVDYANNEYIVSLQAMDGTWEYIPVSYIESFPNTSGVLYERKGVTVVFPALPSDSDYQTFVDQVKILATEVFGVDIETNIVHIGHQYIMTPEEAELDYNIRQQFMQSMVSSRVQIQVLETENAALKRLISNIVGCVENKCRSGNGMCFPTFNEDTPGHTGYIDGADAKWCYPTDVIISDNAYDLYLYGQCYLPFGKRPKETYRYARRSKPFTPTPTDIELGRLPSYPDETNPSVIFPVTAGDLLVEKPSNMEILAINWDEHSSGRYLRRSHFVSGSITNPEVNTGTVDTIVKFTASYQNRATTAGDLSFKNIESHY